MRTIGRLQAFRTSSAILKFGDWRDAAPWRWRSTRAFAHAVFALLAMASAQALAEVPVDRAAYDTACGIDIAVADEQITIEWNATGAASEDAESDRGRLRLNLAGGQALIDELSIATAKGEAWSPLATQVEPTVWVTVGTREAPPGRPLELSKWQVFFDNPAKRQHQNFRSNREPKAARVSSQGRRATVAIDGLTVGPFQGEWAFTIYDRSPLVHVEAVVSTDQDDVAMLYDAALVGRSACWKNVAWMNHDLAIERLPLDESALATKSRSISVKHRAIVAESEGASLALFSAPHQYQFPRDYTTNLGFVWCGGDHRGSNSPFGLGICQHETGGGNYVPWFNAPPGTKQRLSMFLLAHTGDAAGCVEELLKLTRGDRFAPLPGHITYTSHYHMAIAVAALAERLKGVEPPVPSLVEIFKGLGVQAVHLGEFHGDGHPKDPGPLRLREMESMMVECRRLSDEDFLLIPGEEANEFLGIAKPGQHPGHWMLLFPKPVYWTMVRGAGQPFVETDPRLGKIYHVGGRDDMFRLVREENALAWTAHPRIKASNWTPDAYRQEDFYLSDHWLGAAWKAMPADLSREKLGERCLTLLDDMCNWGQKKYLPGEVDVFKIDPTHELYGSMNANYLRLDRLPRFDEGWRPILDALSAGAFFTTTGEIMIREFKVGGKESGQTLKLVGDEPTELALEYDCTFPLNFIEIISGDGQKVYRERFDQADTLAFSTGALRVKPTLAGRKWVRVELWDIARNGAYTQPVWLE